MVKYSPRGGDGPEVPEITGPLPTQNVKIRARTTRCMEFTVNVKNNLPYERTRIIDATVSLSLLRQHFYDAIRP